MDGYAGFEDTTIFSESDNSGGGTTAIFSGTINNLTFEGDTQHRRALIGADLSVIPPGWIIEDVSLRMTVEMSGGNFGDIDYALHRLTKSWGEGDVVGASQGGFGGPANDGDATWTSNQHNVATWTDPGADYVTASATAAAGTAGSDVTWTGVDLIADVQTWVNSPARNRGWIVIGALEGTRQRVKRFYSSEASQFRPVLTVTAKPGPPLDLLNFPSAALVLSALIGAIGALNLGRGASMFRSS